MHPRGGSEVNSLTQGAEVANTPVFLTAQREENLRRAVVQTIPQQLSGSLLYLFYFKGCKRFDCLRRFFPAETDC